MEECEGCAKRRKEAALMAEAFRQWVQSPLGPNMHAIYLKLRERSDEA